ncbi:MAG: PTS galactitol transporter subunit IIC [Anaerostipes sp.]|nr:PTS galactitol transporter subunit IIC [Anaerostipes sp.]
MDILQNIINWLLSLGAAIFVPIIIIIAGLIVGMKLKEAISAGITLGVAFTGMSMLIGFMSGAIGPAAEAMLKSTGINLPIVDGGWTTLSAIAWSWPYAFLMFPLMIGINIVMLIINKTKTFNADLWNVWGKIFTGVAVAAVCKPYFGTAGSIGIAFVTAGIQIIFELKMADMYQYRIEKLSGIPGVTCTHKMGFTSIFMFPIDCLLKKIPGLNRRFDAAVLKDKIGIFAESHVLGFILGIVFGVLARYKVAAILTLGIQASAALTLFPVISKYFMMALEPISTAISTFMNKKFQDRTLVVGLDWPFMGGANEIWLAVFFAIPVTLVYSMFLPGNELLPFAGIVNNAIAVAAFLVTGGNVIRMCILVLIFAPAYLWVGTIMAPFVSDLARTTGAVSLKAGELISCSSIDGPIQTYAFSHLFKVMDGNFLPIALCVIFVVCFVALYKYLGKEEREGREIN